VYLGAVLGTQIVNTYTKSQPIPLVAIVDDDDSLRSSTRMLLSSFGFRTDAFASARDLLNCPWLGEISCLILDVMMPEVNGLDLQRQLLRMHPGLPIIFITAHAREHEERQAMNSGAIAVLRKPVAEGILLGTLRSVLTGGAWKGAQA
jgi:FixJ family two-component response regulator